MPVSSDDPPTIAEATNPRRSRNAPRKHPCGGHSVRLNDPDALTSLLANPQRLSRPERSQASLPVPFLRNASVGVAINDAGVDTTPNGIGDELPANAEVRR